MYFRNGFRFVFLKIILYISKILCIFISFTKCRLPKRLKCTIDVLSACKFQQTNTRQTQIPIVILQHCHIIMYCAMPHFDLLPFCDLLTWIVSPWHVLPSQPRLRPPSRVEAAVVSAHLYYKIKEVNFDWIWNKKNALFYIV